MSRFPCGTVGIGPFIEIFMDAFKGIGPAPDGNVLASGNAGTKFGFINGALCVFGEYSGPAFAAIGDVGDTTNGLEHTGVPAS